jgi:hypothetical protein
MATTFCSHVKLVRPRETGDGLKVSLNPPTQVPDLSPQVATLFPFVNHKEDLWEQAVLAQLGESFLSAHSLGVLSLPNSVVLPTPPNSVYPT